MSDYDLTDDYIFPEDVEEWLPCPHCLLRPKVWVFDNGRSTGCGCGNNKYDHFSIRAESVVSVYTRDGSTRKYRINDLKKNWNYWVKTGKLLFIPTSFRW